MVMLIIYIESTKLICPVLCEKQKY